MAMIKCPECGRMISDRAPVCLGCGITKEDIQEMLAEQQETVSENETVKVSVQDSDSTAVSGENFSRSKTSEIIQTGTGRQMKCIICKTEYNTKDHLTCPKCNYPARSFCTQEAQMKEMIRAYRKATGIGALDLKVGQYYKMGRYGGEEINWRVLAVESGLAVDSGKALLISEKGLDAKRYHEHYENITWETCTLRKWLNQEFVKEAFNSEEASLLVDHKVPADKNPRYREINPGNDTNDQVFLLSIPEVQKYFKDGEDRKAYPTECAKKNGAYVDDSTKCCWWWLRSPGRYSFHAANVPNDGSVHYYGSNVDHDKYCVRPALWINLES